MNVFSVIACAALAVTAGVATAGPIQPITANGDLSAGIITSIDGIRSFRSGGYGGADGITSGDTYDAALLGQSTAGGALITNTTGRVTNFVYDLLSAVHGTLAVSNATVNVAEAEVVTGPNSLRIVIGLFTADSSSLWLSGITIGGQPMNQGRVDVGGGAFTDGLLWDNLPGAITSVTITNIVLADGVPLATSSPLTNLRTLPEMGTAVIWNGITGSPVDETQMVFDITFVPAPSSLALLAVGGLAAFRRRR